MRCLKGFTAYMTRCLLVMGGSGLGRRNRRSLRSGRDDKGRGGCIPLDLGHPKGAPQIPRCARNDKKERAAVRKGRLLKERAVLGGEARWQSFFSLAIALSFSKRSFLTAALSFLSFRAQATCPGVPWRNLLCAFRVPKSRGIQPSLALSSRPAVSRSGRKTSQRVRQTAGPSATLPPISC
jgi:hypothetical protein